MRFSAILVDTGFASVEFEKVRIVDFFLTFPRESLSCKLPKERSLEVKKLIKLLPDSYCYPGASGSVFHAMSKIHNQVICDMAAKQIIDKTLFVSGLVQISDDEAKRSLLSRTAAEWGSRTAPWYIPLLGALIEIPLNKKDGLKDRSGLLEYRYDE